MAMEKLILKSVMYGVDKVPDSWFEKVPGGYFKEKDQQKDQSRGNSSGDRPKSGRSDTRKARPEDFYRESDRHRSEGRSRRDRRSRSSYDGGADEEDYHESGDDRKPPARERTHRRRRSFDDDRYSHNDGYSSRPRTRDSGRNGRPSHLQDSYDSNRPSTGGSGPPPNPYSPNKYIPTVDTAGPPRRAATFPVNLDPSSPTGPSPDYSQRGAAPRPQSKAYVPYAHIYGESSPNRGQFSRPSTAEGPKRPDRVDSASPPVAPPPGGYQQNQFAQQAPTAVEAGAGMQYNAQPGFINKPYDPRFSMGRHVDYDGARDLSEDGSLRSDEGGSYESDEFSEENGQPHRSGRRRNDARSGDQGRPKPKSGVGRAFDKSHTGVGYGAAGAAAGGMIGSSFGTGPLGTAVGAGLGGLGANALQAKQQRGEQKINEQHERDE